MTRYPSIKRRLRKLYLRKRSTNHNHPAYDKCNDECTKNGKRLEGEIAELEARRDKINRVAAVVVEEAVP